MHVCLRLVRSATLLAVISTMTASAKPDLLKALLVTGGCCHDYKNQKVIITQGISQRANVTWKIVHEGGSSTSHKVSIYDKKGWEKDYDVVVHNECFAKMNDDKYFQNIVDAHTKSGVGVNSAVSTSKAYALIVSIPKSGTNT